MGHCPHFEKVKQKEVSCEVGTIKTWELWENNSLVYLVLQKSCRGKKNLSLYLAGGEGEPKGVDEMDYKVDVRHVQHQRCRVFYLSLMSLCNISDVIPHVLCCPYSSHTLYTVSWCLTLSVMLQSKLCQHLACILANQSMAISDNEHDYWLLYNIWGGDYYVREHHGKRRSKSF